MSALALSRNRIGLVAGALIAVAVVVWWWNGGRDTPESSPDGAPSSAALAAVPKATAVMAPVAEPLSAGPAVVAASEQVPPTSDDAQPASGGHARELERIDAAVVTYAVESLPALAVYLTHADATVREAAREGFLQMGLTEGAAHLRAAADKVSDPREAVQLLDAADFLDLPSVPVTGGRELRPVSPQTRERLERERGGAADGRDGRRKRDGKSHLEIALSGGMRRLVA